MKNLLTMKKMMAERGARMNKELEAYFKIDNTICLNSQNIQFGIDVDEHIDCQNVDELVNCLETIKKALEERKAIDNANPSEALECLEKVYSRLPQWDLSRNVDQCNIIKQALLKAQKEHKTLEIIKEKDVDIYILNHCKTVDEYNSKIVHIIGEIRELTEEEFNLLKEVLE